MLTKKEICEAYRFILQRPPESEGVIENWQRQGMDAEKLSNSLLRSDEFRIRYCSDRFPARAIVFIHIPKTAGTALRENWLIKCVRGEWYWHGMSNHAGLWDKMKNNSFLASTNSMIGGHKPIGEFIDLNISQPVTYLSVVRKPIDRAISYFNFIKANESHRLHASLAGKTLLESVSAEDGFGKLICGNEQLTYLFDSSKSICEEDKIIIGKQEFIDEFLEIANNELSFESSFKDEELTHENVGKASYKKEIMEEEGFDEAVDLLTEKLAKETTFYDSFENVLNLDSKMYEKMRIDQTNL